MTIIKYELSCAIPNIDLKIIWYGQNRQKIVHPIFLIPQNTKVEDFRHILSFLSHKKIFYCMINVAQNKKQWGCVIHKI